MENAKLDAFTHPIRTVVTEDAYYALVRRAKIDGLVDVTGYVDVDGIFRALIDSYGSGDYVILPPKKEKIPTWQCRASKRVEGKLKVFTARIQSKTKQEALDIFARKHNLPEEVCRVTMEVENGRKGSKEGS